MFIDTVLPFGSVVDVICTVHIKRCANRFFFFTAALLRVANRRVVSSVGRAPVCRAGGRGF